MFTKFVYKVNFYVIIICKYSRNCILAYIMFLGLVNTSAAEDLLAVYQLAMDNDPVLKQAYATQNAINEMDDQGLARLLPTLSATLIGNKGYLENRQENFIGIGNQNYWASGFALQLKAPIIHYDYWIQLNQADNQIAGAIANYELVKQNTTLKVVEAYFKVLAAEDDLKFLADEKKVVARKLEQATEKHKAGLGIVADIQEAQAAYDGILADEISAENLLADERQTLVEIVGIQLTDLKKLDKKPELIKPNPVNVSEWERLADSNNLNIIALSNELEVARKAIEIQQSGHYPQLDLLASHTEQDSNSTFGLRGSSNLIGLQLNVPIFEGGMVSSKIRQAGFEYEAAKEKLDAARRTVQKNVNNAYRGVITSISRAEALKTSIQSGESALESTETGFDAGKRTILDVITEVSKLHKAKRNYSQALYSYIVNRVKLKFAISDISKNDLQQINYWLAAK